MREAIEGVQSAAPCFFEFGGTTVLPIIDRIVQQRQSYYLALDYYPFRSQLQVTVVMVGTTTMDLMGI
jgi:hypothetical protein